MASRTTFTRPARDDPVAHIIAIALPRVAEMGMTKYVSAQREEGRVELRSANMTVVMAPP